MKSGLLRGVLRRSASSVSAASAEAAGQHTDERCPGSLPSQAQVVICGGGLIGNSIAYHLARDFGWTDVVLLEQGRVTGGSSLHWSGLLGQLHSSSLETRIAQQSIALYKDLQNKGLDIGWKQCGSVQLAQTKDRLISFKKLAASAKSRYIECELLTPSEAQTLCPLISTENLEGGLWIPDDGVGDPVAACLTLSAESQRLGVKVIENCPVRQVVTDERQRVKSVLTDGGSIACQYFVNSAGFWSRHVGQLSEQRVRVPSYPCEHHYLHTLPIPGLGHIPVIRDYDGGFYIRERNGCILAGGFEPKSKPLHFKELPDSFQPLAEDWDQFYVLLDQMLRRVPSLATASVDRLCNGPESFTPDCKWIVGEAPEIKNYFLACGMKSTGLEASGGVGLMVADWIVNGEPAADVWELDARRFIGLHNNRLFLGDRVTEVPALHYGINYPLRQYNSGRCLRMPPIYPRLKAAGAYFGQKMGFERPCYFASNTYGSPSPLESGRIAHTETFGKPHWIDYCRAEYQACRERVGLLDYSSFTKLELWSPGQEVVEFLQRLCSNDVDIPVGHIAHTGMQNEQGGYENDCSFARLAENHYMMIGPTDQHTRCQVWLRRHLPQDSPVVVTDVTSMYTALCIMGPASRALLSDLTETNVDPKEFPFFTYKEMDVGLASGIRAMNLTHTGELGWVLYIPNEYALHVYDHILETGKKYGIEHAGYFAMRTLRIEKFYAFWGKDLDTTTTPLECGRAFRVKFDKGDFIGREALVKQRDEGVKRRYVQLVLEGHDPDNDVWPWGDEPIYLGDRCLGRTSTTGYGYTLGRHVCLGFIQNLDQNNEPQVISNDFILKNNFEVDIVGKRFQAKANIHSPKLCYDSNYMATR